MKSILYPTDKIMCLKIDLNSRSLSSKNAPFLDSEQSEEGIDFTKIICIFLHVAPRELLYLRVPIYRWSNIYP